MSKVPAYRYDLFINVFEKKVAEYQQMIRRMERMEQLYNIVREVGEAVKLPNDQKLNCDSHGVGLIIHATHDDTLAVFDKFAADVGAKLHAAGLHRDGVPLKALVGLYAHYIFYIPEKRHVAICVVVPQEGMRDVTVTTCMGEQIVRRLSEERMIGWWRKTLADVAR